jgi:carboxylesterase
LTDPEVLEGAEAFTLGDGPVGALLIHGLTGSPQGMRGLGEHLAERGVAVEGIRLPGHGTTWQDLTAHTAAEWVEAVDAGFDKISHGRDATFVVGLSGGGTLAIEFAARNPERVAGLVTLAGMVYTKDPRRFFAPVIRRLTKSVAGVGNDIADPRGREIVYERLPTAAAHELLRLCKRARAALPLVRCPILIMHGRNDHTVHPSNAQLIFDSVSSRDKELVWMERSYHVITLDYDRDEVFRRTYEFMTARSSSQEHEDAL